MCAFLFTYLPSLCVQYVRCVVCRSDTADFIFSGGQSMTWLVGHKLVTITTSGCLQHSLKQGPCDRCALLCRQHVETVATRLPPVPPVQVRAAS